MSSDKNTYKDIGNDISINLSSKYSQKLLGLAEESSTDALKTVSKRATQNTAEVTGHLIRNNITGKITKVSRISLKNSQRQLQLKQKILNTINKYLKKDISISPEEREQSVDDLRLI